MYQIHLNNTGLFQAKGNQTLLDAAHQAKQSWPYSCQTGRCSACKCKVLSGQTTALASETGLTECEKNDGWVLACVRCANSNLELEAENWGELALPPAQTLPCRIQSLTLLADDVMRVLLRLPPASSFDFLPGQFLEVIGPQGVRRSYSLAQADTAEKILEIHVRAVEGGSMSQFWFSQAKVNDLLRLHGPLGTFFLRDVSDLDLVLLATGTGIAPIKAILESLPHLSADRQPKSVTILWGGRTRADHYMDLGPLTANYRFIPVLSRANEEWTGSRGYVQDTLLALNLDLSQAVVYACGSPAMINSSKAILIEAGLHSRHFYSDAFVCSSLLIN
jgi:CDP-4-dehydro-6-deoxyglucose reductase